MTINLKIEIIKIFTLEFSLSSQKKEEKVVQESIDSADILKQPSDK
jgi:hypothetical protein